MTFSIYLPEGDVNK